MTVIHPVDFLGEFLNNMWEINNAEQWNCFLGSIILGVVFGILYVVLKSDRLIFMRKNVFVFFQDIFFFIICGFMSFGYMLLTTNGEIRTFVIIGSIIGFYIFCFLSSEIIEKIIIPLKKITVRCRKIYKKVITDISEIPNNVLGCLNSLKIPKKIKKN